MNDKAGVFVIKTINMVLKLRGFVNQTLQPVTNGNIYLDTSVCKMNNY